MKPNPKDLFSVAVKNGKEKRKQTVEDFLKASREKEELLALRNQGDADRWPTRKEPCEAQRPSLLQVEPTSFLEITGKLKPLSKDREHNRREEGVLRDRKQGAIGKPIP